MECAQVWLAQLVFATGRPVKSVTVMTMTIITNVVIDVACTITCAALIVFTLASSCFA